MSDYLTKSYDDAVRESERLRGLLTRIHGIAAEPRPINMKVRLENIACIAQEASHKRNYIRSSASVTNEATK